MTPHHICCPPYHMPPLSGERGMASRTTAISLGQGQGRKAAALIADAASSGSWVVLQVGMGIADMLC